MKPDDDTKKCPCGCNGLLLQSRLKFDLPTKRELKKMRTHNKKHKKNKKRCKSDESSTSSSSTSSSSKSSSDKSDFHCKPVRPCKPVNKPVCRKQSTVIEGRLMVNEDVARVPHGTTVYASNACDARDTHNILLVDAAGADGHALVLGRRVKTRTDAGDVLAEYAGMSSCSANINGSLRFVADRAFDERATPTAAHITINGDVAAAFRTTRGTANVETATITLGVYAGHPPAGRFQEGTLAILKTPCGYKLIVFNGKSWDFM